ncbi:hypothetical protein PENTCL1PPCAC_1420, partial [Pristionchus entomophagus]
ASLPSSSTPKKEDNKSVHDDRQVDYRTLPAAGARRRPRISPADPGHRQCRNEVEEVVQLERPPRGSLQEVVRLARHACCRQNEARWCLLWPLLRRDAQLQLPPREPVRVQLRPSVDIDRRSIERYCNLLAYRIPRFLTDEQPTECDFIRASDDKLPLPPIKCQTTLFPLNISLRH